MARNCGTLILAVASAAVVLLGAGRAAAQYPAGVSYYPAAPVVTYSSPPVVYSAAPVVTYYYAPPVTYVPRVAYYSPAVSYYAPSMVSYAPSVSYYPAPSAVTTVRYGLFGRPRVASTYYYP